MGTMWMPRQSGLLQSRRDFIRVALMAGPVAMALPSILSAAKAAPNSMMVPVKGLATPEDLGLIPGTDWIVTSAAPTPMIKTARTFFVNVRTARHVRPIPTLSPPSSTATNMARWRRPRWSTSMAWTSSRRRTARFTLFQINHKAPVSPTEFAASRSIRSL